MSECPVCMLGLAVVILSIGAGGSWLVTGSMADSLLRIISVVCGIFSVVVGGEDDELSSTLLCDATFSPLSDVTSLAFDTVSP